MTHVPDESADVDLEAKVVTSQEPDEDPIQEENAVEMAEVGDEEPKDTGGTGDSGGEDKAQKGHDTHGGDDHHGGGHGHGAEAIENETPYKLHVWVDENPCLAYWTFLCMFFACAVILIPLIIVGGDDTLTFTTEVPMYMRDHPAYENSDAMEAGEDDSTWQASSTIATETQSGTADVELKLLFIAEGSSLTKENLLTKIENAERRVREADDYEDYCYLIYSGDSSQCQRWTSITHFFDPDYFKGTLNQTYDVFPSERNYNAFLLQSLMIDSTASVENMNFSAENTNETTKYWAGYARGTINESDPDGYGNGYYDGHKLPAEFYYVTDDFTTSVANLFSRVADNKFAKESPLDNTVKAALSIFSFGYPLQGYEDDVEDTDDQYDEVSEWCYTQFQDYFTHFAEKNSKDLTFRWECGDMETYYVQEVLGYDMSLLLGTFFSVWMYMSYNTGSFWLGNMGMSMIFLNFVPSLLLYRYISQIVYFGTLNFLTMFIIMAIGADDIFVLVDTWQQSRQQAPKASAAKRLTHTLKHAGKVMATTSLSTIFSFIANTTSEFPSVYCFGAFAAWLVFVNYCAVILFYPTVLVVHENYFFTPQLKGGFCVTKSCAEKRKPGCCFDKSSKCYREKDPDKEEAAQRPVDIWFEQKFHGCVNKYRVCVLIGFGIFFLIFFFLGTQLEPDPNPPQLLPDGNNYNEWDDDISKYFASPDSYQITNYIVWGIKKIDRSGTDYAITDDIGKAVYDDDVEFYTEQSQQNIVQFCDDLLCGWKDYDCRYPTEWGKLEVTDTADQNDLDVLKCFMREFRTWVQTDDRANLSRSDIQAIIDEKGLDQDVSYWDECTWGGVFPVPPGSDGQCFALLFLAVWLEENVPTTNPEYSPGYTNYDYWKEFLFAKDTKDDDEDVSTILAGGELTFFRISVLLDAYSDTDFEEGIDLWHDWDDYVKKWKNSDPGTISTDANGDEFVDTPESLRSIFFTDTSIFPYYFLQRQIISESFQGIGLSLVFAFVVLIFATNNWIMAMFSISVIFIIVVCVIGFTVAMGWKLGVIEAIIYVMVVGMSVDYVVHCSEAYLASGMEYRGDRSRRMLGLVGISVLSGAISTIIGVLWLLPATIQFFYKFGLSILFLIAVSVSFALGAFTAATACFGPQFDQGNVMKDSKKAYAWMKNPVFPAWCPCCPREEESMPDYKD